jgi:hypothetical protein
VGQNPVGQNPFGQKNVDSFSFLEELTIFGQEEDIHRQFIKFGVGFEQKRKNLVFF